MQRAQASTVPLAALGKAANSQPWNIKYIWPVEHVLQNGSDPAWGGECCFHGEQDSPQHHLVSIHQSHFLFFAKHQEIRGEVTIFTTGGGRERTTILRKEKKTLHNYSSLAAPHRSRPMSSSWQRPPGPESPHSPPHHHLPLHPARPLNAQLQRDGLLAKHGRQAFLWRAGALRDARSLACSLVLLAWHRNTRQIWPHRCRPCSLHTRKDPTSRPESTKWNWSESNISSW